MESESTEEEETGEGKKMWYIELSCGGQDLVIGVSGGVGISCRLFVLNAALKIDVLILKTGDVFAGEGPPGVCVV